MPNALTPKTLVTKADQHVNTYTLTAEHGGVGG